MSENQGNLALMPVIPPIPEVPKEKVTALSLSGNDLLTAAKKQGKIASLEQFTAVNDEMVRINDFKKQVPNPEHEFVQIKHPISNEWNLIDKSIGQFVGRSKKKFKGIPVK